MKILWLSLFVSLAAHAGWEDGNAGDVYVAEFELTAKDIVQRLEMIRDGDQPVYDTTKLRALLVPGVVKINSQDTVTLRGAEVDAVNWREERNGLEPQKRITVGRKRWSQYRQSTMTRARMRVVAHEFLPLSGVDDRDYQVSDRLIALINPSNFNPDIWWEPVNPVNFVVPRLVFAPTGCGLPAADLNVTRSSEVLDLRAVGETCGSAYRRVKIVKSTGLTPLESNVRGKFNKYRISVFDDVDQEIGKLDFEPAWGQCLLPEVDGCRSTGKMTVGGVEFVFWFLRK